jgi:hypothetical protein
VKVNSKVLAEFVDKQIERGMLTHWHVALFAGDRPDRTAVLAGLACHMNTRGVNTRAYDEAEQVKMGRYIIRRLLAPRDEAIDLTEEEYSEALALTQAAWQADPGRSRRKTPPDVPSGPAIRTIRGQRHPERALLLLYPLDPQTAGIEFANPIMGFGASFPRTTTSAPVTYTVNNVYWEQEFGVAD